MTVIQTFCGRKTFQDILTSFNGSAGDSIDGMVIYIHTIYYIHAYIHKYIHTHIHTYVHTYILYTYINTYIHTHTYYIHTYIHTIQGVTGGKDQTSGECSLC